MPPPVGYGEATMWFRLAGDPEEQAITLGVGGTLDYASDLDASAQLIYDSFVGTDLIFAQSAVSNTLSAVRCDLTYTDDTVPAVKQGSYAHTVAGTRTTSPPPSNCAMFVRKNTGLLGRRYKGRMYFPAGFLVADNVSPIGVIEAGSALPTLQTRMTATFDALADALIVPYLLHSTGSLLPTQITQFQIQPVIATQRRRLRP